ncbi:MAG: class I SAM-dependent methyltransferase [Planctomycetes bacterium]|nr:class I SAM-dependent methyltransferase [Planctomycetota bacterium]
MDDPISISQRTFDRLAEAALQESDADEPEDERDRVEAFLMRTGRPVPNVVVLGQKLAMRCRQIEELGGSAVGVDGGGFVVELARRRYPGGNFQRGDLRKLPVETNAFDGVWSGSTIANIPRAEIAKAMQSMHDALRPGGLLYVRLPLGDDEGFQETGHGPVYTVRWDAEQFCQAVSALDFSMLDQQPVGDSELAMIFRREY